VVGSARNLGVEELASVCMRDLADHLSGAPRTDDLTLMVVRRSR
jgi:serine phosphatase RsbU (regulator of sigma subunit)